jgi:hypothetical protein
MTVALALCIVLMVLFVLGKALYYSLACGSLDTGKLVAWKLSCLAASMGFWPLAIATYLLLIRFFPKSEEHQIVTVGLLVAIFGAAVWERARDGWKAYWEAIHDSLDHATNVHFRFREKFNAEHKLLLDPEPEKRKTALARIFDREAVTIYPVSPKP